jgi:hypothetical protein
MKKNLKGIIVGIILFIGVVGGIIYWQANKKVADPTDIEASATLRVEDLLSYDSDAIKNMTGDIIAVTGIVLSNVEEGSSNTITLGMNEMDVIVCQMDSRHLDKVSKLTKGHFVKFKGKLTGHDFDEMMGKTIQMKNCVLTQ